MKKSISGFLRNTVYALLKRFASKSTLSNLKKVKPMKSIFDIPLVDIQGRTVNLNAFKGKKILVVNTASECGYTPQYAQLEELHQQFGHAIAVLGFPCNDFGGQEPGSELEIKTFCQARYGVTFPLFSKLHVTGVEKHPLYSWLTDPALNGWNSQEPTWNFCKYVIDEEGKLLHFLNANIDPFDERISRIMEKIIEVRGLTKSYGSFKAVDQLDLDVYHGDVFGFLGPNGAGKSTTIRMLLTLIKPDSGEIRVFGKELHEHRSSILSRIGCIVEKPDFYKFLSARKNLEVLAQYNKVRLSKTKIDELLEFVGLKGRGDDAVKGYSHGMKQRLGLAQALLHDPDLIILDEPTTGLDPQGIIDIRNLILYLSKEKGKTIFLSSHILHELELVASRMAILNKGKMVLQGSLTELLHDSDRVVEIRVENPVAVYETLAGTEFDKMRLGYSSSHVQLQLGLPQIPLLLNWMVANNVSVFGVESRRQLEDLFLKLTESAERMLVTEKA
jgi:ABC-type multidrug transport system ATPase subunit/glutathione peroxidase-family protein